MSVSGTVEFTVGGAALALPATTFPSRSPVQDVHAVYDAGVIRLTVRLGQVQSEQVALPAAEDAMLRVWGALLVTFPDSFAASQPPFRSGYHLKPEPSGAAVAAAGVQAGVSTVEAPVAPDADALRGVSSLVGDASWDPASSLAYRLFARAVNEPDPVLQFLALYSVLIFVTDMDGKEPTQKPLDDELRRLDKSLELLTGEGEKGKPETKYTRARNRLLHPRGHGVEWDDATKYATENLRAFRSLLAERVVEFSHRA